MLTQLLLQLKLAAAAAARANAAAQPTSAKASQKAEPEPILGSLKSAKRRTEVSPLNDEEQGGHLALTSFFETAAVKWWSASCREHNNCWLP